MFFIGATNRPDIIDPALKRPGRLDQTIFIDLPDFAARVNVLQACLRKSPLAPDVDLEWFAEQTDGYSGADLSGIGQMAAKIAIRYSIKAELDHRKARDAKRAEAEAKGEEYESDEDEEMKDDPVPAITKRMLLQALRESKKSVSAANYQKYLDMKKTFDEEQAALANLDDDMDAEAETSGAAAASSGPRNFADDDEGSCDYNPRSLISASRSRRQ